MPSAPRTSLVESAVTPVSMVYLPNESRIWGNIRVIAWNNLEFFQLCEKMAGIVETRGFLTPVFVLNDPAAIADVLVNSPNSFVKPYALRKLRVLFGKGLLTSDGAEWKHNRHLLQPAFSAEHLPGFVEIVQKNTREMLASWRDGEERDLYHDMVELCMKNVTQALFGVYDDELADVTRELAALCHQLVKVVFSYQGLLPFLPPKLGRELRRQIGRLDAYLDRLIEQRSKEPPRDDFLGIMLSGGGHHAPGVRPMSRQAIRDEAITILLAGHETTASGLVWCLYLLANHPQCAEVLAAELEPLQGEVPSLRDLDRLPLLRAILDESLRLYPPTHRIGRTVKTPVMVGGHLLPKGAEVLMPQWSVHRSSRWYDRPGNFLPERWTPEFRRSLPRFAYFPFSGGPHSCVGGSLAWSESVVILGGMVQQFQFTPCDKKELEPVCGLTLLPGGGCYRVRVERRGRDSSSSSVAR